MGATRCTCARDTALRLLVRDPECKAPRHEGEQDGGNDYAVLAEPGLAAHWEFMDRMRNRQ